MAFKKIGSLDPHGAPLLRVETIKDSIGLTIGMATETGQGSLDFSTAGRLLFGNIDGIVNKFGITPSVNGNSGDFTMFYKTASDNTSVGYIKAQVDISKFSLYSVDPNATIGTTLGSNKLGTHTDVVTGGDLTDESSAIAGTAQYTIHGVDPADSGNQVVNIYESQIFGV